MRESACSRRADSPLIEVALDIAGLAETTAIVQTPTNRHASVRTDDLGFAAFTHPIDNSPIISGTITYRREWWPAAHAVHAPDTQRNRTLDVE